MTRSAVPMTRQSVLLAPAAEEGTLVWGLEQTAGRGRRGRAWSSPRGNLYASLILRPRCPLDQATQLGFIAALAVGDTLSSICEGRLDGLSYKWPNDVLVRGRKIAGILLESELGSDRRDRRCSSSSVSASISCRRRETRSFQPHRLLKRISGRSPPAVALEGFARHFQAWAERWREEGFAPVRAAWRAHAAALGRADPGAAGGGHLAGPVPRHRSARCAAAGDCGTDPAYLSR